MEAPEAISSKFPDRDSLLESIATRDERIIHLDKKILCLEEQLAWFKRQVFGKRSERIVSDLNTQQLFFEGFESPAQKKEETRFVS